MLTLDLPPQVEQLIIDTAKAQGISINELIAQHFTPKNPLIERAKNRPNRTIIGMDAVATQRQWRDEWENNEFK